MQAFGWATGLQQSALRSQLIQPALTNLDFGRLLIPLKVSGFAHGLQK